MVRTVLCFHRNETLPQNKWVGDIIEFYIPCSFLLIDWWRECDPSSWVLVQGPALPPFLLSVILIYKDLCKTSHLFAKGRRQANILPTQKKKRCQIGLYKKSRDGKNKIIVAKLWLREWRKGWIFTSEKDKSSLIPAWTSAIFLCSCQFFHSSKIIKTENYTFLIHFKRRQRKKKIWKTIIQKMLNITFIFKLIFIYLYI